MKCSSCSQKSEYICPCNYIPLCHNHITSHSNLPGLHPCENLNITKVDLENQWFNEKVLIRIKDLENLKQRINVVSMNLTAKVAKYNKIAFQKLNRMIQLYLTLIQSEKLSTSLKIEAENILTTSLKVKEIKIEIDSLLEDSLTRNLISIVKNFQPIEPKEESISTNIFATYDRSNLQRRETYCGLTNDEKMQMESQLDSIFEEKKKIENKFNKTIQVKNQIAENSTLEDKKAFMSSKGIESYDLYFGPGKYYRDQVHEIKISNDKKFCFVCKKYLGTDI